MGKRIGIMHKNNGSMHQPSRPSEEAERSLDKNDFLQVLLNKNAILKLLSVQKVEKNCLNKSFATFSRR